MCPTASHQVILQCIQQASHALPSCSSLSVVDLDTIEAEVLRWNASMSNVRGFYAMKCNSDPRLLELILAAGFGINCSTSHDIVKALQLGASPTNMNLTHPYKSKDLLLLAKEKSVQNITVDSIEELNMLRDFHPSAKLLVRIASFKATGTGSMRSMFGISPKYASVLFIEAQKLGLVVNGVSFHVEAEPNDPDKFCRAMLRGIDDSVATMRMGREFGFNMAVLDIGGGFTSKGFESVASSVSQHLAEYVPKDISVIAEPGRLFVSSAVSVACKVLAIRAQKQVGDDGSTPVAYVGGSIYSCFFNRIHDPAPLTCELLGIPGLEFSVQPGVKHWVCEVRGCTTNGPDLLLTGTFPREVRVDDWLLFGDMGAYSENPVGSQVVEITRLYLTKGTSSPTEINAINTFSTSL